MLWPLGLSIYLSVCVKMDISLGREVAILRDDMVKGELEANVAPWTPALGASLVDGLAWGWEGKPE
jgi:hypothetical protein